MADLEADVDDPPDTWKDDDDDDEDAELAELEDEEGTRPPPSYHDSTSIGDRMETPNLSNAVSLNDNRALNEPLDVDSDLAAQSRQLSITNLAEDKASILNRANANGGPSLISRRMASRPSFGAIGETSPAEPTDADLDNMNLGLGDQDHTLQAHPTTPRGAGGLRTPTPTGGDRHAEALLTPTNDAGPFVFDGSAGRTGGRRVAERPGDESSLE
ncbi:hypothetical protein MMC19_001670 [Ptychographa xylographoides]|nr:hypothetical protein [Ptychographa xylographoides]